MTHRDLPACVVAAPPRYPSPVLAASARVATVSLDGPVGFVVFQEPDSLAWWPYRPDRLEEVACEVLRDLVRRLVLAGAARGATAEETWSEVLRTVPHDGAATVRAGAVAATL
jgi:hypothetical protein